MFSHKNEKCPAQTSCVRLITEGQDRVRASKPAVDHQPAVTLGAPAGLLVIGCYWQADGFTSTWLALFTAILDHSLLLS